MDITSIELCILVFRNRWDLRCSCSSVLIDSLFTCLHAHQSSILCLDIEINSRYRNGSGHAKVDNHLNSNFHMAYIFSKWMLLCPILGLLNLCAILRAHIQPQVGYRGTRPGSKGNSNEDSIQCTASTTSHRRDTQPSHGAHRLSEAQSGCLSRWVAPRTTSAECLFINRTNQKNRSKFPGNAVKNV